MDKQHQTTERYNHIKSLYHFVSSSKTYLSDILHNLNWTEEITFFKDGEKNFSVCPLNEEHRVGCENLEKHLVKCSWRKSGYRDDSLSLPKTSKIYETTVILDKNLQADVILKAAARDPAIKIGENVREREVPQTSDRVFSDFTTDERRVLYDYVVSRTTAAVPRLSDLILPSGEESKREPLTKQQLMTAERDAKRRRIRYRTAKVHTKSKNYSEIMREVINNQMLVYEDWLKDQSGITGSTPSIPMEKAKSKESVSNNQEMVWLDWDYRTNPHVRWKSLIEQEKRKTRRKETDNHQGTSNSHDYKRRDKETSVSRSSSLGDESRKYNESHRHRHEYHLKEKDRHGMMSHKEFNRDAGDRRENKESTKKVKEEYEYKKHPQDICKQYEKTGKQKGIRHESEHHSSYRDYHYNSDYYKNYKYEERYSKHYRDKDGQVKVKEESKCNESTSYHNKQEEIDSFHKFKYKEEKVSSTESDDLSDNSSYSSSTKKQSKRKKKSKKKDKKRHKKKHKSKRSRRESSSSRSFD